MSQNTFIPTGSETHLNARDVWNGNAADAESRLTALELVTPQVVTSSSGVLLFDNSLGGNLSVELFEDITNISFTNVSHGDSGLIEVTQDSTGSWTLSAGSNIVLSGDLADIVNITPTTGVATIGWYYDDSILYLYVSAAT
tara:strand:+ start:72 stop:494 length:423 start_codon:yes stop_codon:yes gene_type:complete